MRRTILSLLIAATSVAFANAQEPSDTAALFFRQGQSQVDLNYRDNRSNISPLIRSLRRTGRPLSVKIAGSASPEGSTAINAKLSHLRAQKIYSLLNDSVNLADTPSDFTFIGRDWQGLRTMVAADPQVPSQERVITLLDTIIGSISSGKPDTEANLTALKTIGGGAPYAYMYSRFFPALRTSRLYVTLMPQLTPVVPQQTVLQIPEPTIEYPAMPIALEKQHKPFYMALKTNMLYDALAIPSLSAEFYLGKNWSIVGNWMYGWWDNDHRHRYWRAYGGDLAVRRWFGSKAKEKPLTGHHIGLYAGVVTYDFEFGGKGWMGGQPGRTLWDRCNTVAGIEYGYSLPIGRRLNIDFTIGVGYLGGKVVHYIPGDGFYLWQKTKRLNWVGPTKAEISLVWLIGRGNYNAKKGGLK